MGQPLILAGDVGGTKTYLATFEPDLENLVPRIEARYDTPQYPSLGMLLRSFVDEHGERPTCVAVGVPGPVRQLPVRAVNLPWLIHPDELREQLRLDEVVLLNDLEATSYGTQVLGPEDLVELNPGSSDPHGNIAVIAAGTGLGEGGLCWTPQGYAAIASEGGHASFSPTTEQHVALWRYLNARTGHVSWERVVSGPGLVSMYEFLRDGGEGHEPEWLAAEMAAASDRAGVVSRAGLRGRSDLAAAAMRLFVWLYGAEAGNLALKVMATGGVFVGGGIAPKIIDKLREGAFVEGYLDKGRMDEALRKIPVRVILNDKTGMLGAAYRGAQRLTRAEPGSGSAPG